jgi:uncharacterized protein (TIGR00369 family)
MEPSRSRTFEWQDPALSVAALAGKSGLAFLRSMIAGEIPMPPIAQALGFALTAAEEGFARFESAPAEYQYNPMATVHGGVVCTLLDSAMGCAVMTTLDPDTAYTTAQLAVHLTRPITIATQRMIAEAKIVHRGNRIATAEGRLLDERGRVLAHGTTTCAIFPRTK